MTENQNKKSIMALFFIIPFMFIQGMDNDTFWLVSIGRHILSHGFTTDEFLTFHEFRFIPQQWLFDVISAGVYDTLGIIGIFLFELLTSAALLFLLYRLALLVSGNKNVSIAASSACTALTLFAFSGMRPHLIGALLIAGELLVLEKYVQTNQWKWLCVLPFLVVANVNIQAATWPMLIVVMLPYLLESVFPNKMKGADKIRRKFTGWPLWITLVVSCACSLLNPYGFEGASYLFRSFGVNPINQNVTEMMPPSFSNMPVLLMATIAIIALVAYRHRRMPIAYLGLFAGFSILALMHVKGVMHLAIVAAFILAWQFKDAEIKWQFLPKKTFVFLMVFTICVSILPIAKKTASQYLPGAASQVMQYIDDNIEFDKNSDLMYTDYNSGGSFELEGYHPYIDARAEAFLKANNGKEDILNEYFTAARDTTAFVRLTEKYRFRLLVIDEAKTDEYIRSDDLSALKDFPYELVYHAESEISSLSLWVRIDE